MKQCEICDVIFANKKQYANHIRWVHKKIEYKRVECNFCKRNIRKENVEKHLDVCVYNPKNAKHCTYCGKQIFARTNKFCSSLCCATYNNAKKDYSKVDRSYITEDWKKHISQKIKHNWAIGVYKHTHIHRSKPEIAIVNFFKTNYSQDKWKSGGQLRLSNGDTLSRDLYSDKLRICFEYDGIWHFENICGQLEKKQLKDKLLEEWCLANNYRLIRVDELSYIDVQQIEQLIYNSSSQIIKVGNRY